LRNPILNGWRVVVALTLAYGLLPQISAHSRPRTHQHHGVAVIRVAEKKPIATEDDVGFVDLRVKAPATRIWINGVDRGTVGELTQPKGILELPEGIHRLRLELPDGAVATREFRILPGSRLLLGVDLR
jgi:hypothetical protein